MPSAGLWMLLAVAGAMLATGLPAWLLLIAVAMAGSAIGVLAGVIPAELIGSVPPRLLGLLDNDLLQALPLYVLLGALLNRLPLAQAVFRTGQSLYARTGAGASLAGLSLGVLLAPMNGSVGASVNLLARTVAPALEASGLARPRAAALVATSGTLGLVVPPSLVLILLGDALLRAHTEALNVTHQAVRILNTQDVFRGALVPAALLLAMVAAMAWWQGRARGASAGGHATDGTTNGAPAEAGAQRGTSLATARDIVTAALVTAVIGGLLVTVTIGYLYAVEAAAGGAVALFVYGLATRTLTRERLRAVLAETMALSGALMALLVGATVFTFVLRAYGTDRWVADWLGGLALPDFGVLLVGLAVMAACAFVLDAFEMIFVVVPVVLPPLLVRVPDAAWVAVLTLLVLQTSFLVPPFGYAALMVRQALAGGVAARALARALLPYLVLQVFVLALVLALPQLIWRGPAEASAATPADDAGTTESIERQLDEALRPPDAPAVPATPKD